MKDLPFLGFRKFQSFIGALLFMLVLISCNSCNGKLETKKSKDNQSSSLMVFAAASLQDVITEIADTFEIKQNTKVQINFASSGTLARQIEQGGTADIYISANNMWMEYLDSLGIILKNSLTVVAKNELVMITPKINSIDIRQIDSTTDILALLGDSRLSIGNPQHVPAGQYAKEALEYFQWYDKIDSRILPSKDVRSALKIVEIEEAKLGIVYGTDAVKSPKVKIVYRFPENSHSPVVYVAGLCSDNKMTHDFYQFVNSSDTEEIWMRNGFKK